VSNTPFHYKEADMSTETPGTGPVLGYAQACPEALDLVHTSPVPVDMPVAIHFFLREAAAVPTSLEVGTAGDASRVVE
jgi:hypothetical protein